MFVSNFSPLPVQCEKLAREKQADFFKYLPVQQEKRARLLCTDENCNALLSVCLCDTPFLRDLLYRQASFALDLLAGQSDQKITSIIDQTLALDPSTITRSELMRLLREYKQKLALGLALLDLGGVWSVEKVTKTLSLFADAALLITVRFCLLEEAAMRGEITISNHAEPEKESGIILLAMGKHGAFELNYSSDIDLIAFYDGEKIGGKDPFDYQTAVIRVTKRIAKIMQERTEHGYVFRMDFRLRPDPGATAIAISTEAAVNYYESIGQNWERAAFIKARPVSCDLNAAHSFLEELRPFIWRKYMDFTMISEVHAMKRQTHKHWGHGSIALAGHDIKLGQGGIREIEFFVQTQQLIAGGRNVRLRGSSTLEGLSALAENGWVDMSVSEKLADHYRFLRNIEHRIQMRNDEQTHCLPSHHATFEAIGRLMGFHLHTDFERKLLACLRYVSAHYGNLFETATKNDSQIFASCFADDSQKGVSALKKLGFARPHDVLKTIQRWQSGYYKAMRSKQACNALSQILPQFLQALAASGSSDEALFSFDAFLKNLPAGAQLFGLLKANDHLLDLLATIMGCAPRLANTIAHKPHIFDALLDPNFFGAASTPEQLYVQLSDSLANAADYQECLDRLRMFVDEHKFLIGTRLLSGTISPRESQKLYSNLADVVVVAILPIVINETAKKHGRVEDCDISVLALGKLGGQEMSPNSDLDLILIYDVAPEITQSDGQYPLVINQYFARITQRFIAALAAPSGEGVAYNVDMRLRPSGKAGPLATEIKSFVRYQHEAAWNWEHMALTRARAIGGSDKLRTRIMLSICHILSKPRDKSRLANDVLEMNCRVHDNKKALNAFEVKQVYGGLIDLEFLVQFSLLHPQIEGKPPIHDIYGRETNTRKSLFLLRKSRFFCEADYETLVKAYDLYSDFLQITRLCLNTDFDPNTTSQGLINTLCKQADVADIAHLSAHFMNTQKVVREIFVRYVQNQNPKIKS